MGCCPLAPASAFHLCVCLPCCFLRERKMPGFSRLPALDPHSTTRLAKPSFLLWKQKHQGLGRGINPLRPGRIWPASFITQWGGSAPSGFWVVWGLYIRGFVRRVCTTTAQVARGGTQQSSERANEWGHKCLTAALDFCVFLASICSRNLLRTGPAGEGA